MEIYRIFRDSPKSFIDFFKRKSKSEIENSLNLKAIRLVITHLHNKAIFPFETKDQFQKWIDELLFNLKDTDQETIKLCIYTLGNIVANSPKDPDDNIWPAKYLRETIEVMYAHNLFDRKNREHFEKGVITYKFNSIGLVFIDETDPGKPYADLAEQIRKNIIDICDIYPCTTSILEKLARTYQRYSVFSANWNA